MKTHLQILPELEKEGLFPALINELDAPLHTPWEWKRSRRRHGEVSVAGGVSLVPGAGASSETLKTAYADFHEFLQCGSLLSGRRYPLHIVVTGVGAPEEYRIEIEEGEARILAADPEGVRRALIWMEDEILGREGPFLPRGSFVRRPAVQTRISRCIYSPINRAPSHRDELADEHDYYPEGYLNRLAHCGVNGLFIVVKLSALCPSGVIPEYGRDSARRLAKLRRIVEKCARYGIRVFPLCIDPAAFVANSPVFHAHPDLAGHRVGHQVFFCTESKTGAAYLEEVGRTLFEAVPGLGGMIVLSVGEAGSHCYSGSYPGADLNNNCPRCCRFQPWEIMERAFQRLEMGIHSVAPAAQLISWPYGQFWYWNLDTIPEAAAHVPEGVTLMHNFESSGQVRQLGRLRTVWDYSLSYTGPSEIFVRCAEAVRARGTPLFAKLQTGCSFETGTVPFVPVPGILYDKYREIHRLGVTGVLHGWYHGNYPSLMTKAAVELSMTPFPRSEREFLLKLARKDWGAQAGKVCRAWNWFKKAYKQLPATHVLGWYGPTSNGTAWPLYLEPRNLPLSPSWELGWPPSGDHVGECAPAFTISEVLMLLQRVSWSWERGVEILRTVHIPPGAVPALKKDMDVAEALLALFQSSLNIFTFYALREELAFESRPPVRKEMLHRLSELVHQEMQGTGKLLELVRLDPRLGFQSEAEGYMFSAETLEWRLGGLRDLLEKEFPAVEKRASLPGPLFPEYSGAAPGVRCASSCPSTLRSRDKWLKEPFWAKKPRNHADSQSIYSNVTGDFEAVPDQDNNGACRWSVTHDRTAFYFRITCEGLASDAFSYQGDFRDYWNHEHLKVQLKASGIWPEIQFLIHPSGVASAIYSGRLVADVPWDVHIEQGENEWIAFVRLPFSSIQFDLGKRDRLRFNVEWQFPIGGERNLINRWTLPHKSPLKSRLTWGNRVPNADFGWILLNTSFAWED